MKFVFVILTLFCFDVAHSTAILPRWGSTPRVQQPCKATGLLRKTGWFMLSLKLSPKLTDQCILLARLDKRGNDALTRKQIKKKKRSVRIHSGFDDNKSPSETFT